MESIGVLMLCPMNPYLEQELQRRFNLFRLWTVPQKSQFFKDHSASIRAVVGNAAAGADAELINTLPGLEIVSSFSVGVDKIDLDKCKEKGIRVTNTPDVLTEDVADLAIGLILAVLRRLCECDRYVRSGKWKKGDFRLSTKVICFPFLSFLIGIFVDYVIDGFELMILSCKVNRMWGVELGMMVEKDSDFIYMMLWSFDSVVLSLISSFYFCFVADVSFLVVKCNSDLIVLICLILNEDCPDEIDGV